MAAGVGKTYRMLQEGRAAADDGRDVVVGVLETHGRAETAAQAEGLEIQPLRVVDHRSHSVREMDLPGLLARAPELCLVDELAHSNPAGRSSTASATRTSGSSSRPGIDVYTTVNVQHLESLNDQVAELTGVRVRETFPDRLLAEADEVVLVDITPEALITRLREGRVYPQGRVQTALENFFRIENLQALREVALRQVAEEVEAKRLVRDPLALREERLFGSVEPKAFAERLLALAKLDPSSERVVRRAWRSAQRLHADLDILVVRTPGEEPSAEDRAASSRRCGASPRSSARSSSSRRATTSRRWRRASRASAARPTSCSARRPSAAASAASASRCRCASSGWRRTSTCGSWRTAGASPPER